MKNPFLFISSPHHPLPSISSSLLALFLSFLTHAAPLESGSRLGSGHVYSVCFHKATCVLFLPPFLEMLHILVVVRRRSISIFLVLCSCPRCISLFFLSWLRGMLCQAQKDIPSFSWSFNVFWWKRVTFWHFSFTETKDYGHKSHKDWNASYEKFRFWNLGFLDTFWWLQFLYI